MPSKPKASAASKGVRGRRRRVRTPIAGAPRATLRADIRNPRGGMKSVPSRNKRFAVPGKSRAR